MIELKNPHPRAWHNVKLTTESAHFSYVEIIPEIIKQLDPYEEIDVCVRLRPKEGLTERGVLEIIAEADEFSPTMFLEILVVEAANSATELPLSQGRSIIQINRGSDLVTYLYGLGIIILLTFFIWRKIRLRVT
ncbi:MAG: hypothetical protein QME51_06045 [Planctomycetota bacterium]|nr:hypothetical protein [Planctomycetota bacterium]